MRSSLKINDSTDSSQEILRKLCANDKHLKAIFNQVNFGVDRSGTNCMMNASGDAYIGITCDFQDPPTMIPQFIKEWENGYKIVVSINMLIVQWSVRTRC